MLQNKSQSQLQTILKPITTIKFAVVRHKNSLRQGCQFVQGLLVRACPQSLSPFYDLCTTTTKGSHLRSANKDFQLTSLSTTLQYLAGIVSSASWTEPMGCIIKLILQVYTNITFFICNINFSLWAQKLFLNWNRFDSSLFSK